MAKLRELTLDQARENSSCFLYVFADNDFLQAIDSRYAQIIYNKKLNEKKLLALSADKYLGDYNKVQQYYDAVEAGFKSTYSVSPVEALNILASGGSVAGKNWKAGVFGIGATKSNKFKGTDVTVNPDNGYMMVNGSYKPVTDTVYGADGNPNQQFWYNEEGHVTFMSQRDEKTGKWYAAEYEDGLTGTRWTANGKKTSKEEAGSFWENVNFDWDDFLAWLEKIANWLLGKSDTSASQLNANNTLPNQTGDGFVYSEGAGSMLLLLAAGGALLAGGLATSNKKKK